MNTDTTQTDTVLTSEPPPPSPATHAPTRGASLPRAQRTHAFHAASSRTMGALHRRRDPPERTGEPLLALADLAGEDWPTRSRNAAVNLTNQAQDNNPIGALLLDIMIVFIENETERLFTRDLLEALLVRPTQRETHR